MMLSIGILSWGQHLTLVNTLRSYKEYGLLDYPAAQKFIFFQEITKEDIDIAYDYGFTPHGSSTNLGIAGGYREMLGIVNQPNYLFLENDWAIIEPPKRRSVAEYVGAAEYFLEIGLTDVVRFRHRTHPGGPLWSLQFKDRELERPEHLLDCLHWRQNPDVDFPEHIRKGSDGWYMTIAPYANWTNNPHMVRTDWVRNFLLPKLGEGDIERDIQDWWRQQSFRVIQGDGLFTHWRIG